MADQEECNCDEYKRSMVALDAVIFRSHTQGLPYSGAKFVYCPWCGKKIPANKSVVGSGNPDRVTELMNKNSPMNTIY